MARFFPVVRVRRGVCSSSCSSILISSSDTSTYVMAPRDRDDVQRPADVSALVDADGPEGGAITMGQIYQFLINRKVTLERRTIRRDPPLMLFWDPLNKYAKIRHVNHAGLRGTVLLGLLAPSLNYFQRETE